MADTRTIYLHTDDTIFTSDPTDTDYTYLDMSEYDSLNPEYSSTIRVQEGVIGVYDDYNVKITLTFTGRNSGRDERADWVNKYGHKIKQISVATTPTKSYVFNKSATVSSIEMIDTEFVNGAMVVINLTLFGRWQSSLSWQQTHTEDYSGGTKKYYMTYKIPDYTDTALTNYAYTEGALVGNSQINAPATNEQGQTNQLFNTEFTPDLQNWSASNNSINYVGINSGVVIEGSNTLSIGHDTTTNWATYRQQIANFIKGGILSASVYARATAGNWTFAIDSYDASRKRTVIKQVPITTTNTLLKIENVTIPSDAKELYFSFWGQTEGAIIVAKPMLAFDKTVGSYVEGNYVNNDIPELFDTGTNKYSYNYKYGSTIVKNQIELDPDKNRFIIVIEPNYKSGSITLSNEDYSATITSSNLSSTSGISSDFITYTTGLFNNTNKFTMLDRGYVASTVWDNISDEYAKLYSITNTLNTDPANINVTNEAGQHVPFSLYVYSIQDFI